MKKRKSLKKFFNPKTIAVVGASNHPGKVGYTLMQKLLKFGGEIIPINIKHDEILGKKVYASLRECQKKIDLAVIAIPAKGVKEIFEECGRKKIKNVIIISAGFSEIGDRNSEREILKIAKQNKINLLGPNCFGIANPHTNLDTTFANCSAKKGDVAFISQSGALWSYIADISQLKQMSGFSGFVSLGNMADLNFSDFIEYFNKDKNTKKIILYIEKLKQGKRFINICKKSKKEIIVIKAGKSEKGVEATISHTGSLATDFEIYKGAFKQANIKLVNSISEAFGSKINFPKMPKAKTAIITNAGGAAALITDYIVEQRINVEKPIDLIGTAQPEDYKKTLDELKSYPSIIVILTPQTMSLPEETAKVLAESPQKNKITAFFLGENSIKKARNILKKAGIPCFTRI
ncbi:CoA-binding protein [Candidatus Pacearchaeota archaeon]|nr:CoA-binding protein [Candidatus Pacearchaeota archaeon]